MHSKIRHGLLIPHIVRFCKCRRFARVFCVLIENRDVISFNTFFAVNRILRIRKEQTFFIKDNQKMKFVICLS